jgi:hypothetical protein
MALLAIAPKRSQRIHRRATVAVGHQVSRQVGVYGRYILRRPARARFLLSFFWYSFLIPLRVAILLSPLVSLIEPPFPIFTSKL